MTGRATSKDEHDTDDLIRDAEEFVKDKFRLHDPSHDWHHVHRVRLMALNLSRCPSLGSIRPDLLVLELAALFHDLCDAKYLLPGCKSVSAISVLSEFFQKESISTLLKQDQVDTIYRIVDSVSWSKEQSRIDRRQKGLESESDLIQAKWEESCLEFHCVSDADRLDSIGSIGILRVAAYSAAKNGPLHIPPANPANDSVPPAEQAQGYNESAIAHFHSKLLKIKGNRLKTDMARQEAERRQSMMSSFLQELDFEWLVADQGAQMARFQD